METTFDAQFFASVIDLAIPVIFVIGFVVIIFEHRMMVNKAAPAVATGALLWTLLAVRSSLRGENSREVTGKALDHHMAEIGPLLFLILAAMAIVEMIDKYEGFRVVTDRIQTTNKVGLYWIVSWIAFWLSAGLESVTTIVVMTTLLMKFVKDQMQYMKIAAFSVIAVNAGGAWSVIGDIPAMMAWIGGQVTALHLAKSLFLPSVACLLVPLLVISIFERGKRIQIREVKEGNGSGDAGHLTKREKYEVFFIGVGTLICLPIFKLATGLHPCYGAMGGLGLLWLRTEIIHAKHKKFKERKRMTVSSVLSTLDLPTILFFWGILFSVGALQTGGYLTAFASWIDAKTGGNMFALLAGMGALSTSIDQVPAMAALQAMYPLDVYPANHIFWVLAVLLACTCGSILIIGSAPGVTLMGILNGEDGKAKLNFAWYALRVGPFALLGVLSAIGVYVAMNYELVMSFVK